MKRFKKLAIISDCVHYFNEAGLPVTENHIFKRQMEMLAGQFDETLICCPFDRFSQEKVISIYDTPAIQFLPLPNVGGNNFSDKIKILKTIPAWWKSFKKINHFADIVYQRFPNNINIPGFVYFWIKKSKVFATYTGAWTHYRNEPFTYRLQKWFLRNFFRGPVFIYAECDQKQYHLVESFSPSYILEEWNEEMDFVQQKIEKIRNGLLSEPVFVCVGSLVSYKNQQFILDACLILKKENFLFTLYIVGDGPLRESYQEFIDTNQLEDRVFLTGKKKYEELRLIYRQADFLLQASLTEGFGKTPMEGFFHGVIPVLSETSYSEKMTAKNKRGFLFPLGNPEILAGILIECLAHPQKLTSMIEAGRTFAQTHTLENWIYEYMETINGYFENN